MVNAQEWLDRNYFETNRGNIIELDISLNKLREEGRLLDNEYLEEGLELKGFVNLEKLDCSGNQLTALNVRDCSKLISLDAGRNQLGGFTPPTGGERLEKLNLMSNRLGTDLAFFARFSNLKELFVGNRYNADQPDIYNRIDGSLEVLKVLTNLKELNIENTDVGEGLEYLPDSIESFWSLPIDRRPNARVERIFNELEGFPGNSNVMKNWYEELKEWRARKFVTFLREREDRINMLEAAQFGISLEEWEIRERGFINERQALEADRVRLEEERDDLQQQLQLAEVDRGRLEIRLGEVNNELNVTNNRLGEIQVALDRGNACLDQYRILLRTWDESKRAYSEIGRRRETGTPEADRIRTTLRRTELEMRRLRGNNPQIWLEEISEIVMPGIAFNFSGLRRRTKELKIRDLRVEIERLTNIVKNSLGEDDRSLVDEFLQELGDNPVSENLRNREQELRERISERRMLDFQGLLDKQREIIQLRMQQNQQALIQQVERLNLQ